MNLDSNARYAETHEWARQEGDLFVCGITDHAQEELSDVVYVELPEVGTTLAKGEHFGVIESVKAASDLYIPMGGEIAEVNETLEGTPEMVNSDPYGEGWMVKMTIGDTAQLEGLMDAAGYKELIGK